MSLLGANDVFTFMRLEYQGRLVSQKYINENEFKFQWQDQQLT